MKAQKTSQDINTLLDLFGIEAQREHPILQGWLDVEVELSKEQQSLLDACRQNLLLQGSEWNEEELKLKFLSFLFYIADIEVEKRLQTFFERPLATVIDGVNLSVISDCMVATPKGKGAPKSPYFFLQEFKKQKGDKNDPEGQMFTAMLIAQHLNADQKPVYGAWLVGNQWCFTILTQKIYTFSHYFDATDPVDLKKIVAILRQIKTLVL